MKRARFLLASTSEVYGDPQVHPQPETYWGHVNPIGPRGVYDEAKRYAEALTMAYHRQQGVDTAIVRIFNTYGPRMRPHDGRAIPTFIRQALEEKPLTVFGSGAQTRSFCFVDDLVRGLILLAESGEHLPGQHRQPGRDDAARARRGGRSRDRIVEPDRLRGAAGRRSTGPPARHHARPADSRLGARDRARRGPAAHAGVARQERNRCVRQASSLAAAAFVAALVGASTAQASKFIQKGIYDDAQILYGNPDKTFPMLQQMGTQAGPGQPVVGRAERRRPQQAAQSREPGRPRLRLGHLRPHRALRVGLQDGHRSSR